MAAKSCQLCFIAPGRLAKVPAKCIPCYGWGKPLAWLSTAGVTGAKRRQAAGGTMIGGSDRQASSDRTPLAPRPRRRARGRPRARVLLAAAGGIVLASSALAACGTSSASTSGPVTLNFYQFPDVSGATQQTLNNCSKQSGGKY